MRLARKLFLLAAITLTALTTNATAASAEIEIIDEATAEHCSAISLEPNHIVNGGCHITLASPTGTSVALHAYIPAKTTISSCEVELEGQIGEGGEGYVTEAVLSPPHGGTTPCTRAPCDEADDTMIPWPFHVREHGPGDEELEGTFCIRDSSTDPGTPGVECEVHLPFTDLGNHEYESGHGTEVFCENNPPNTTAHPTLQFPVSIEPNMTSGGGSTAEIVH